MCIRLFIRCVALEKASVVERQRALSTTSISTTVIKGNIQFGISLLSIARFSRDECTKLYY